MYVCMYRNDFVYMAILVINARDDPFIEESSLPRESDLPTSSTVRLIYHDHGGHCGFHTTLTGAHDDPNLLLPDHGEEYTCTVPTIEIIHTYILYIHIHN